MSILGDYDKRECQKFLEKFGNWLDPTWGFYVYDNVRLQAVVSKLRAHAEDYLRYANPPPYNQQLIDTLRLEPAAYLPGVPLANVCRHFRKHFADGVDPEGETESDDDAASYDSDKYGPKWNWFLVIDDEAGEH